MKSDTDDFDIRKQEIEKYFEFIEKLENDYRTLSHSDSENESYRIDEEHLKIFRANGFLILYNLIESTILNCVVSIFDEISTKEKNGEKIAYVNVTQQIKKYWLKSKYNHDDKIRKATVIEQFYLICEDITSNISIQTIKHKVEFGGNLNALKIRKLAEDLGVELNEPHYKAHLHGEVLKNIKQHRNDLAHGHKSFTTIGRDITYFGDGQDGTRGLGLIHFKNYTIEHLESFRTNIENYIINEKYLVST